MTFTIKIVMLLKAESPIDHNGVLLTSTYISSLWTNNLGYLHNKYGQGQNNIQLCLYALSGGELTQSSVWCSDDAHSFMRGG